MMIFYIEREISQMAKRRLSSLFVMCLFLTAGNSVFAGSSDEGWISLFDGKTLDGWVQINGTTKYEAKDGTIVGTTVKGSPNSFLCTKKHYSDFELEFEVKLDSRLNSGVQIRSHSLPEYRNRRVHGYQVEISTKGNAGFIYDEARRGWLSKDRSNEEARQAFKKNKWNEFRVLCAGDSIKTWVNGVPVAHVVDSMTPRGFIGLQVHGFKGDPPAWVQWRNVRIKELKVGSTTETLKVVVVTGGHGFEREPFLKIFDEIKEINYVESVQKDHSELFEDISTWDYDVMVFYNMTQEISEKQRKNLFKLLDKGVGVVALHHTMGAYQEWPEFKRIIGTKYYLKDAMEGGVLRKQGSYKHDLDVKVHVKDKKHPITKGMSDFTIHDETYKNCWFDKNNQLLLTTDHATSDETIGWVRQYSKAKVCTIQLGHDSKAYSNSNYRQLVKRAILWTAGKL
jgi:type 1 glutamine amidotransferase